MKQSFHPALIISCCRVTRPFSHLSGTALTLHIQRAAHLLIDVKIRAKVYAAAVRAAERQSSVAGAKPEQPVCGQVGAGSQRRTGNV
jgi:hypothetical protein